MLRITKIKFKPGNLAFTRRFSQSASSAFDYSHVVIGGGVVGLATAAKLAQRPGSSVLLLERHTEVGTETSARNSEVIHAALYYPPDSLKTKLCLRGKELIYSQAKQAGVEMKQCGKWIVAQDDKEAEYLQNLHSKTEKIGIPTELLTPSQGKRLEPAVRAASLILNSPTTGIISSHSLMSYLEGIFSTNNGDLAVDTTVTNLRYLGSSNGFEIATRTTSEMSQNNELSEETIVTAENVVNSAGLGATAISNMLLPKERHVKGWFARGSYFAYSGSQPKVNRLIYPCPSASSSLGTHLTIDLGGRIKFGPNIEWTEDPGDVQPRSSQLDDAYKEVIKYLPNVDKNLLSPDYAGIRPKIVGPGSRFQDFVIRKEEGFPGFINLLGIESPGLTSSMAIAEYVDKLYN